MTFALLTLALLLRLIPSLLTPHGGGVDQWFWRAYIEKVRRDGRFPPDLPQFRLDRAQWYPPLFPWLLAKAPAVVFERYADWVAILLDLLRLGLLIVAVRLITGSEMAVLVAGMVYILTPLLTTYNMQLNPRGLGALFLDAAWLCLLALYYFGAPLYLWGVTCVLVGLVFITHKMTSQVFLFVLVMAVAMLGEWRLLLLVPGGMLAALTISGGFYRRVLRAHADITCFWFRNWRWSGSNPILESPIYGEPGFESPSKFYRRGLSAWVRRLQFVIGFNPWMIAVMFVGGLVVAQGIALSDVDAAIFFWLTATFAFGVLTTLVPQLRCFGQGYLYGYNGAFPAAMAWGQTYLVQGEAWTWRLVAVAGVAASGFALFKFFQALRSSRTMKVDAQLEQALSRLAQLPDGTVMCLPQHWHDAAAYRTGKPVAFGGHGYGFDLLRPVFPRLLVPVKDFLVAHRVRYLLVWQSYVNDKFLMDLPEASVEMFGDYRLYCFGDSVEKVSM